MHERRMGNHKMFCFALIVLSQISFIAGQNCIIGEWAPEVTVIDVNNISETNEPGTVIWVENTENVVNAVSATSPHSHYVEGFRYSSRYEYRASDDFYKFVATERSTTIERNTTFTCADGQEKKIFFRFHLLDENNSAPEFQGIDNSTGIELTVSKAKLQEECETQPDPQCSIQDISTGYPIIVRDMDLLEENANVLIMTTRPSVFRATISKNNDAPFQNGHEFDVTIQIVWSAASFGTYTFDLIADDRRFARAVPVNVTVLP